MFRENVVGEFEAPRSTTYSPRRKAALVAGIGLLLMVIPPIFADFFVVQSVLVPGDAAATASNILANQLQFSMAVLCFLFVIVLDVIVSWGLYIFFKPVDANLSLLAAWFRLMYTAILAAAALNLGNSLHLVLGLNSLEGSGTDPLQAQVLLNLNAFRNGWDLGLVLFGIHLALLGYLMFRAGNMPKLLAALLVIAGLGYLIDTVTTLLWPDFGVTVSMITFIGELLLAVWLVIKGVSNRQWEKLALEGEAA